MECVPSLENNLMQYVSSLKKQEYVNFTIIIKFFYNRKEKMNFFLLLK